MYSKGKGISGSTKPFRKSAPSWVSLSKEEITSIVCKLAKKGETPSKIGSLLRDHHGIGCVKQITGKNLVEVLEENSIKTELPEDLYHLIKKAASIRKHLLQNKKDMDSKYHLNLTESRIYRLSRYYKRKERLSPTWRYEPEFASALIS